MCGFLLIRRAPWNLTVDAAGHRSARLLAFSSLTKRINPKMLIYFSQLLFIIWLPWKLQMVPKVNSVDMC
jgi:hypothetical protein